jgi:ribosomal protein S1
MLEALPIGRPLVGRVALVLPFGAFVDLDGVVGLLPASEFATDGETPQDLKLRNEPESEHPVARGRGVQVEVVSVDADRGRAALQLARDRG